MLASGAHVQIGDKEFRLAMDIDGAYSYSMDSTGEETLFWLMDDWSGGEGNDVYDPTDEIVYHQGNVNPRRPGILTTPPVRNTFSTGALSPVPRYAWSAVAGGKLFVITEDVSGGNTSYWYTTNMTSFTEETDTWNGAIDGIAAVCTDGTYVYILGQDVALGGYQIRKLKGASLAESDVASYNSPYTSQWLGMGVLNDYLYLWDGAVLDYRRISEGTGATQRTAFTWPGGPNNFTDGTSAFVDYWGGVVQGEGSLFFFLAWPGNSTIFEVDQAGAVNAIWTMPSGFTAKSMCYQSGAIIIVGEYLGSAAAYGMSTLSRQPLFLGFIRYGDDFDPAVCAPGYGTEVIITEKSTASGDGRVFIYDIGQDAFTQLDQITHASGECWSAGVFGGKRFIVVEDGNDANIYAWSQDDDPSTTVNGRMETGAWDFDLPEDEKQLDGFHVLSDANSTKTVDVYYQDNEDGTWTQAGTATTGFHNFITVSDANSTVKFRTLRFRVDPKTGAKVYAVSARTRVNTYEEKWELLLDLSDEVVDGPQQNRRRSHQDKGWQLRDYIRDIADNKTVVTFKDGARYPQLQGDDPDKYSTHTVVVDIPVDRIEKPGEGTMLVRLRSVVPN